MLTETKNLEIVFHQNLSTLTESADGEPDLYYFGINIGNWRQLFISDQKESNILHVAAKHGNKMVEELFKLADLFLVDGKLLLIPDHYKRTPLHWALLNQHYETAEMILNFASRRGFDASSLLGADITRLTPLDYARKEGNVKILTAFRKFLSDNKIKSPFEDDSLMPTPEPISSSTEVVQFNKWWRKQSSMQGKDLNSDA